MSLNRFFEQMIDTTPEVGTPGTIMMHSDRIPVIVTEVVNFKSGKRAGTPKEITVVELEVTADPKHIGYGTVHLDRPKSRAGQTFTLRSDGYWKDQGGTFLKLGHADYYYDPSF